MENVNEEITCQCEGPGTCPFWEVEVPEHIHNICSEKIFTHEHCQRLKRSWLQRKLMGVLFGQKIGGGKVEESDLPSLSKQVGNVVSAAVKMVRNGAKFVSEEIRKKRMDTCLDCDRCISSWGQPRCTECGCFVGLKTKIASESCPLDKWGPEIQKPLQVIQRDNPSPCAGCPKQAKNQDK